MSGSRYTMPFGRHKGQMLCQVPDSYLSWLATRTIKSKALQTEILIELEYREGQRRSHGDRSPGRALPSGVSTMAERVIITGYRSLSMDLHPDRHGPESTEAMADLNSAVDFLRESITCTGSRR